VNSSSSILDTYSSNGTFEKAQLIHTFGKVNKGLFKSKSRKKLCQSTEKMADSGNTSKYSISDKENHLDVKAIIPSKVI